MYQQRILVVLAAGALNIPLGHVYQSLKVFFDDTSWDHSGSDVLPLMAIQPGTSVPVFLLDRYPGT
jgi:hypothetical protein